MIDRQSSKNEKKEAQNMTEKLFYMDSHLKEFDATVISCEPYGEGYLAVLDRTAFFPEGGGQASDTGWLNDTEVSDVQEKNGSIYHYIKDVISTGVTVHGKIQWEKRFSRMQQHTAEHIISGLVHKQYAYRNVGFHLADTYCTMDFDGPLSKEQLQEIERKANEAVFQNILLEVLYPSKEELEKLDYRSKIEIEGQVRIVRISGYDVCACCAPHVKRTGEIGLIKMVHVQNYKGGVRITMLSGDRALADYRQKEESVKNIMSLLTAKEELVVEAVEQLKEDNNTLKMQMLELQRSMLRMKAEQISADSEVCIFEDHMDMGLAREFMNLMLGKGAKICAVFCRKDEKEYRYVIGSKSQNMQELGKYLYQSFSGKGGGKPDMIQGTIQGNQQDIEAAFHVNAKKGKKRESK